MSECVGGEVSKVGRAVVENRVIVLDGHNVISTHFEFDKPLNRVILQTVPYVILLVT